MRDEDAEVDRDDAPDRGGKAIVRRILHATSEPLCSLKPGERIASVLSVLLLLVTFGYTIVACRQLHAMREAVSEQTRAMKLTNRARVVVATDPPVARPVPSRDILRGGFEFAWSVRIANLGRGMANKIRSASWSALNAQPHKSSIVHPGVLSPQFGDIRPLGPDQQAEITFAVFLDAESTQSVLAGLALLTIQGVVADEDEIGDTHDTSVCVTFLTATSRRSCPTGNWAN